jgi:hypothetical protein
VVALAVVFEAGTGRRAHEDVKRREAEHDRGRRGKARAREVDSRGERAVALAFVQLQQRDVHTNTRVSSGIPGRLEALEMGCTLYVAPDAF